MNLPYWLVGAFVVLLIALLLFAVFSGLEIRRSWWRGFDCGYKEGRRDGEEGFIRTLKGGGLG